MKGENVYGFHTTQWTAIMAVRESSPEARTALGNLCGSYYEPVRKYIERSLGFSHGNYDSGDLAQEFFLRVIEGTEFKYLQRERGRFRAYLLGAVKFFLAEMHRKNSRLKRGGGNSMIPLDENISEHNSPEKQHTELDARFDREWAEAIVGAVISELRAESENCGESERFEILRDWLTGDGGREKREAAMKKLEITEGHFKVLVSRLRKRFRTKIHERIARTVENEEEVGLELDYLVSALSCTEM